MPQPFKNHYYYSTATTNVNDNVPILSATATTTMLRGITIKNKSITIRIAVRATVVATSMLRPNASF